MKRKYYLIPLISFALVLTAILVYENIGKKKIPYQPLLDRTGAISTTSEWKNTKAAIIGLQDQIRKKPSDHKSKLMLALAYMQEARITGEHPYYYPAALDLINDVLDSDPEDMTIKYEAMVAKSSVLLSLHHFGEALEIGNEALKINKQNASIYGILCDAHVELGQYETAVAMADKMVSIRPDIRSYARVSYLREIYGDMNGAIEAMKMAVAAGYPGLEQTAWTRFTLGNLHEKTGDLSKAESQYKMAIAEYPNYAFAISGLGKIEVKKKNYSEAVQLFQKAGTIIPEFSFQENLTELYQTIGEQSKAQKATEKLLEMLDEDADAGHNVDLELAGIYIQIVKDYDKALEYANAEYKRRPDNIDVCKTLAHVYYKKNDYQKAAHYLAKATRTHRNEASLLCLEGLIDLKIGKKETGILQIRKAFELDPYQSNDLAEEGRVVVKSFIANKSL